MARPAQPATPKPREAGWSPTDQATLDYLRRMTPAQAARIVRQAGIVLANGELNPLYAPDPPARRAASRQRASAVRKPLPQK